MIEESEIITLLIGLAACLVIFFSFREKEPPPMTSMYAGFLFIVAANVFSVIEGLFLHELFDGLEHLCHALAGISFAIGLRAMYGIASSDREEESE